MTHVKCNVSSCSYNKNQGCYMDPICVGGKGASFENLTCCGSYLNKQHYSNLAEYTCRRGQTETVNCNVYACKHNENNICSLSDVQIAGSSDTSYYMDTVCNSFEKG